MRRLLNKLKNSTVTMVFVAMIVIASAVQASAACQLWYVQYDVLSGKYETCILVGESGSSCVYRCR
jgi:hypothetical protein